MIQAQEGDQHAYGALLNEVSMVIRAYLVSKFGRLENLDDCVQEALLSLHQARHTYDASRPFRPWLFAIVRNRTIDLMRQSSRRIDSAPLDEGAEIPVPFEPTAAIDTGKLLKGLSRNLRETLVLTKLLGYSTRQSAVHQGVSESVVKVRVHRGIRKLRTLCDTEFDAELS